MDNRVGWIQPENACQAYHVWNNLWDIAQGMKWTCDKGSIEHSPFPSPVTPNVMVPTFPQETFDSFVVQASYPVQKTSHVEELKQRDFVGNYNQVPITNEVTPAAYYYKTPEVPVIDHQNVCPLYILQMRQTRLSSSESRANRMKEEIEAKRKVNKASIYGRNSSYLLDPFSQPEISLPWKPVNKVYDYNIIG